jgi:hypothetical protein
MYELHQNGPPFRHSIDVMKAYRIIFPVGFGLYITWKSNSIERIVKKTKLTQWLVESSNVQHEMRNRHTKNTTFWTETASSD